MKAISLAGDLYDEVHISGLLEDPEERRHVNMMLTATDQLLGHLYLDEYEYIPVDSFVMVTRDPEYGYALTGQICAVMATNGKFCYLIRMEVGRVKSDGGIVGPRYTYPSSYLRIIT